MELPNDLLDRSAEEGARRVILALLDDAALASTRLPDPEDVEALHDFRVAIRRTRSALRSWADLLPKSASKKLRKRLTEIMRSTGAARDAEVALEWLETLREDATPDILQGIACVAQTLERERAATMGTGGVDKLQGDFAAAHRALAKAVSRLTVEVDLLQEGSAGLTYRQSMAQRARSNFLEMSDLLSGVTGPQDSERLHDGRIACKRLRYLMEPIRPYESDAVAIVKRCKKLQDLLGDINDAHVLAERVVAERAAVPDFTLRTSLDSLRARCLSRAFELYQKLDGTWLRGGLARLGESVDALAQGLEASDQEVERKYLLRTMPQLPEKAEAVEIDQGWLPGKRLRERLRRIRREGSVQYYRTIKLGKGVQRFELEETTSQRVFEQLWPLTEGCRIRKRRHLVDDGPYTWEIDEFLDRELVLAEVELPSADVKPELPDWLAPEMVEEVTDSGEYTNLALASAGSG